MMLGERDKLSDPLRNGCHSRFMGPTSLAASSSSATANPPPGPQAMSTYLLFLSQRPDPKPQLKAEEIKERADRLKKARSNMLTKAEKMQFRLPGGFYEGGLKDRNWKELLGSLSFSVEREAEAEAKIEVDR